MLHSVVSACLHQFGWNFFPTLPSGRGRETQLYRQCFNKGTLVVSNGKGFNCVSRHTGLWSQTTYWKLTSIYGWEKMRGVSDGSEVFQNGERRSQTFRLRLKHRKLALATDQHVPVKRGHQNHPHTTAFNHFARCRSLKPTENAYHLMWCDVARKEAFENSKIRYAQR